MLKLVTHAKIWARTKTGLTLLNENFFTVSLNRPQAKDALEKHLNQTFGPNNWVFIEAPWFEVVDTKKTPRARTLSGFNQ